MKRTPKVLISLLLLVTMLTSVFPLAVFTAGAEDATATYRYKAVNTLEAGKTYLIVSGVGQEGTAYNAVYVDSKTEGAPVKTGTVTTTAGNGMYIDGFAGAENYEWTVIPAVRAVGSMRQTYMFQNKATGAYLYNPVYDSGDGSNMITTLDPLTDNYSPYSRQVFNSVAALVKYETLNNGATAFGMGEGYNYANLTSSEVGATNDPWIAFSLGGLTGYTNLTIIYNPISVNTAVKSQIFYNVDDTWSYSNIDTVGDKWLSYSPNPDGDVITSNANMYRFDINTKNGYIRLSSVFMTKNNFARVALQSFRNEIAKSGVNGYYPSQRFPFTMFSVANATTDSYNFRIANFDAVDCVCGDRAEQYYYGFNGASFERKWLASTEGKTKNEVNNTFFYEKEPVSEPDAVWELVDSADDLVNGGEYIITDSKADTASAIMFTRDGDGLSFSTGNSISNKRFTSEVPSDAVFKLIKVGQYFYLNASNGNNLYGNNIGGVNTMAQGDTGGAVVYGHAYRFTYDFVNEILNGVTVAQIADETPLTYGYGFTDGILSSTGHTYLYKKTYHTHTPLSGSVNVVAPTCTAQGYTSATCSSCGETYKYDFVDATGHASGTFTDNGSNHAYTCSKCSTLITADHVYGAYTYDETNHIRTCTVCGHPDTSGHDMAQKHIDASVCGEHGYTRHYCTVCSYYYDITDTGATKEHVYDGGIITTAPTCTADGTVTYTCENCLTTTTETLPAFGHIYNEESGKCLFCSDVNADAKTSGEYIYKYVDAPTAGRNYLISNTNKAGTAYTATVVGDTSSQWIMSAPATVTGSGYNAYITTKDSSRSNVWKAEGTSSAMTFTNVFNNKYLWGDNYTAGTPNNDSDWINKNIGALASTDKKSMNVSAKYVLDGSTTKTGYGSVVYSNNGGVYLGFDSILTTSGYTIPGQSAYLIGFRPQNMDATYFGESPSTDIPYEHNYVPLAGYTETNGSTHFVSGDGESDGWDFKGSIADNFEMTVTFALTNDKSAISIVRNDNANSCNGSKVSVLGNYVILSRMPAEGRHMVLACVDIREKLGSFVFGNTAFHTLKIQSVDADYSYSVTEGDSLTVLIDGVEMFTVNDFCLDAEIKTGTAATNYSMLKFFGWMPAEDGRFGNVDGYKLSEKLPSEMYGYVFNGHSGEYCLISDYEIVTNHRGETHYYYDHLNGDSNIYYVGSSGAKVALTESVDVNKDAAIAENVFVADSNNTRSLYFYEQQYKYTIEYQKDGVTFKTETGYAPLGQNVSIGDPAPAGYTGKNVTVNGETTTSNTFQTYSDKANKVVVNYSKGSFAYTVKYYIDGTENTALRYTGSAEFEEVINTYPDKCPEGYVLDKTENYPLTIGADASQNVIKVFYKKGTYNYKVEYYYDNVLDASKTETSSATFGTALSSITVSEKSIAHFRNADPHKTYNVDTITTVEANNVIRVHYVSIKGEVTVVFDIEGKDNKTEKVQKVYTEGDTVAIGDTEIAEIVDAFEIPEGYEIDYTASDDQITLAEGNNQFVIKVVKKSYDWKIVYHYDDDTVEVPGSDKYGETVNVEPREKAGFVYSYSNPNVTSFVVSTTGNEVHVYYVSSPVVGNNIYAMDFSKTAIDVASAKTNYTLGKSASDFTFNKYTLIKSEAVANNVYYESMATDEAFENASMSVSLTGDVATATALKSNAKITFFAEFTFTENKDKASEKTAYIYAPVTILEATTIYFEDNAGIITYNDGTLADGSAYGWVADTAEVPAAAYDTLYGYSDTYASYMEYSAGGAYSIALDSDADYADEANATFTFTGTGFDIISYADNTAGIIFVDVTDESGALVRTLFVNNYLGYTYGTHKAHVYNTETGEYEWVEVTEWYKADTDDAVYQIPCIKAVGLPYGTYTVVVTPAYDRDFKGRTTGTTNFVLDAVRIYDPMGADADAETAYKNDAEYAPQYFDIGEALTLDETYEGAYKSAAAYLTAGQTTVTAGSYDKFGPNNEVYIDNGDYIAFKVEGITSADKVTISAAALKITDGDDYLSEYVEIEVFNSHGSRIIKLSGSTDMNYDISDFFDGNETVFVKCRFGIAKLSFVKVSSAGEIALSAPKLTAPSAETAEEELMAAIKANTVAGDIDGDGVVTAKDIKLMTKINLGIYSFDVEEYIAADFDSDGDITTKDSKQIMKTLLLG